MENPEKALGEIKRYKLPLEKILRICHQLATTDTPMNVLARRFGVHPTTIGEINKDYGKIRILNDKKRSTWTVNPDWKKNLPKE